MIFFRLFYEFFKVGLFSIGGGLATLPFLYEIQKTTQWFTINDISNMIAVSESTPGPLGVNMATYVGYLSGGVFGGAIATLGLICPAIVIISIISNILQKFKENKHVKNAMVSLKAASVGLIAVAWVGVVKVAIFGGKFGFGTIAWKSVIVAIVLFVVTKLWKKSNPIVLIVASGLVGFLLKM